MKKLLVLIFVFGAFLFFGAAHHVSAQESEHAVLSAFVRDDCGHCADEKKFLGVLSAEYPNLEIQYYNLAEEKNRALFVSVAERYELVKGTPITMIRGTIVQGFESAETTG